MFDALLADGLASGLGERIATLAVKCLAVAGGFLVGYFLGGVIAWALDRWVFAHKAPEPLKKTVSIVAGIALAIVVALIVFGEGGTGLFGGGGGDGKGTPSSDDTKGKTAPAPDPEPKKEDVPPRKKELNEPPPKPTPGDVRVTILAGDDVKEGRFYLIGDDPNPKNFEEFKQDITAKKNAAKTELTIIFRFKKEELSKNHPAVSRVVGWVNEQKLLNRFD